MVDVHFDSVEAKVVLQVVTVWSKGKNLEVLLGNQKVWITLKDVTRWLKKVREDLSEMHNLTSDLKTKEKNVTDPFLVRVEQLLVDKH